MSIRRLIHILFIPESGCTGSTLSRGAQTSLSTSISSSSSGKFLGLLRDTVSSTYPESSWRSPPSWTCLKTYLGISQRGHLYQTPESPPLVPVQQLRSESLVTVLLTIVLHLKSFKNEDVIAPLAYYLPPLSPFYFFCILILYPICNFVCVSCLGFIYMEALQLHTQAWHSSYSIQVNGDISRNCIE